MLPFYIAFVCLKRPVTGQKVKSKREKKELLQACLPCWDYVDSCGHFHFALSFNRFAGSAPVPVRNQCVHIDNSYALVIRVPCFAKMTFGSHFILLWRARGRMARVENKSYCCLRGRKFCWLFRLRL